MHAWLCSNPVGVEALEWTEQATPAPAAGQVLIAIRAASLNFPDLLIVQNKYQMKPPLPFVPGAEYAGVVEALGEGVTHLRVGQSVACLSGTGGFASHTLTPAALCLPLPEGFPHVDAAAFARTTEIAVGTGMTPLAPPRVAISRTALLEVAPRRPSQAAQGEHS